MARCDLSEDMKTVEEATIQISGGRVLQTEGTACTKALRQEQLCVFDDYQGRHSSSKVLDKGEM